MWKVVKLDIVYDVNYYLCYICFVLGVFMCLGMFYISVFDFGIFNYVQ